MVIKKPDINVNITEKAAYDYPIFIGENLLENAQEYISKYTQAKKLLVVTNETIIVLAATNRPEMLDKALLRPGRFDRQITIPAPDLLGREAILKLHCKDKKIAPDLDLKEIAGEDNVMKKIVDDLKDLSNDSEVISAYEKEKIERYALDVALKEMEEKWTVCPYCGNSIKDLILEEFL
mgnify:CR=1 FL=1